ncbi:hypothetical protein D3C72_1573730 [compost metagenome]
MGLPQRLHLVKEYAADIWLELTGDRALFARLQAFDLLGKLMDLIAHSSLTERLTVYHAIDGTYGHVRMAGRLEHARCPTPASFRS